ncbi:MAG TPA: hypothetical protein VEC57_19450 [Candidatus Limnocylindrales bacterium]|nr:hypothetical protein [Candidatus Limnocylindrales bacterium]
MNAKAVTTDAFALLAKAAALVAVAAAIAVFRLPEPPARLIILALPGAKAEWILDAATGPDAATIHELRESGFSGGVVDAVEASGAEFWSRLFTQSRASGVAAEPRQPVWQPLGQRVAVVAAPSRVFADAPATTMLTASTESAFLGNSAGVVADARQVEAGKVAAPYDGAVEAVLDAAKTLAEGRWSDWIDVPGGHGRFQIGRISADELWLSPVYRVYAVGTAPPAMVLLGDPFLRGVDVDARGALLTHLAEVERTRVTAAQRLLGSSHEAHAVLLFHKLSASLQSMSSPDPPAGGHVDLVREEIDRTLRNLREAAPGRSTVLMVGGPVLGRERSGNAWYLLSDGHGSELREDIPFERLRVLVRYLLGAALDVEDRRAIPPAVLARFPIRAAAAPAEAPAQKRKELPWSVETLQGLASGSGGS